MTERWAGMTSDERERFRQRVRERFGFDPSASESKEAASMAPDGTRAPSAYRPRRSQIPARRAISLVAAAAGAVAAGERRVASLPA